MILLPKVSKIVVFMSFYRFSIHISTALLNVYTFCRISRCIYQRCFFKKRRKLFFLWILDRFWVHTSTALLNVCTFGRICRCIYLRCFFRKHWKLYFWWILDRFWVHISTPLLNVHTFCTISRCIYLQHFFKMRWNCTFCEFWIDFGFIFLQQFWMCAHFVRFSDAYTNGISSKSVENCSF